MPPRRAKKKKGGRASQTSALPGGSEMEALAWGHHTEVGARGELLRHFVDGHSRELIMGTGKVEWALYDPYFDVNLPMSRQQVLASTPMGVLDAAFKSMGGVGRLDLNDKPGVDRALVGISGGKHKTHGSTITQIDGGRQIIKAQALKKEKPVIIATPVEAPQKLLGTPTPPEIVVDLKAEVEQWYHNLFKDD